MFDGMADGDPTGGTRGVVPLQTVVIKAEVNNRNRSQTATGDGGFLITAFEPGSFPACCLETKNGENRSDVSDIQPTK